MRSIGSWGVVGSFLLFSASWPTPAMSQRVDWIRQLGTAEKDESFGVSADRLGNVYISGETWGDLGGPNAGGSDAFVSKYDAAGTLQWTRQLAGMEYWDIFMSHGVSADRLGNVFLSRTLTSGGSTHTLISKFDDAGASQWSGSPVSIFRNQDTGVSADGLGNVYISGTMDTGITSSSYDLFVAKYDAYGTLGWIRDLASGGYSIDMSTGVSADRFGNVFVSGYTNGDLGGPTAGGEDAFVAKYDGEGVLQWTRKLGSSSRDYAEAVSADGVGNVYISGCTGGDLSGVNSGDWDAFVSKYDDVGTLQWTRQLGTSERDWSTAVSADGLGNVYISGYTTGDLGGPNAGGNDAFVAKYDDAGTLQWTWQRGTLADEESYGVSADGLGNVYISGRSQGDLGGPNAGGYDAFVARLVPTLLGDYKEDGTVDAADYTVWRDTLAAGGTYLPNDETPGVVNEDDYVVWKTHFGETSGSGPLLGDYSEDGTVDAADYTVWRDTLAAGGTYLPNDETPGVVNEDDFLVWKTHFGETSGSGSGADIAWRDAAAASVPEPSALVLVLMSLASPAGWRRPHA